MWDTVGRIVMMIATTIRKTLTTTLGLVINCWRSNTSSLWSNLVFFEKIVQDFMISTFIFLSDLNPIIVLCLVTNWLTIPTDSCCWNLSEVTLAFEDANSKLPYVISVADFDAQERFWQQYDSDFEAIVWSWYQSCSLDIKAEVWSKYWSWSLGKILIYIFGQDIDVYLGREFEAEIMSWFWIWIKVQI